MALSYTLYRTGVLYEGDCNDDARRRIVNGESKRARFLYASIRGTFPSWDKDFHDEEFTYIGALENGMEAAFMTTSWGTSTCRGTNRLLLFKDGKYFGAINEILPTPETFPMKAVGNKILFPNGYEIDLSDGVPPSHSFMPAKPEETN